MAARRTGDALFRSCVHCRRGDGKQIVRERPRGEKYATGRRKVLAREGIRLLAVAYQLSVRRGSNHVLATLFSRCEKGYLLGSHRLSVIGDS